MHRIASRSRLPLYLAAELVDHTVRLPRSAGSLIRWGDAGGRLTRSRRGTGSEPQVGFLDSGVGEELAGRPFPHDSSSLQHIGAVGDFQHLVNVLLYQ